MSKWYVAMSCSFMCSVMHTCVLTVYVSFRGTNTHKGIQTLFLFIHLDYFQSYMVDLDEH